MMNQNLKQFIYGAILLAGGLYLGNMIGAAKTLQDTSGIITSSHFDTASSNLDLHIYLLKHLQANETQKVSQKLEELVNIDLITLAEYSQMPSNRRLPSILKSIKNAKEYRQTHPVTFQNEKVSNSISKALDLVK